MRLYKTFTALTLSFMTILTFNGFNNKTENNEQRAFTSIALESNATTLNIGEKATLTLLGTYPDNSTEVLTKNIEYIISPNQSVELNVSTLTALKNGTVTLQAKVGTLLSNTLTLDIVWVVDGHMLPPEPDPTVNNATLAGIDSNNNGVRDDVERKIYEKYPVKLQRALLMDGARVFQKIAVKPVEEAKKSEKGIEKITNCKVYLMITDLKLRSKIRSHDFEFIEYMENITYDTKERVRKYLDYNIALSGGNYASKPIDWNREACSPEVIQALEEKGL